MWSVKFHLTDISEFLAGQPLPYRRYEHNSNTNIKLPSPGKRGFPKTEIFLSLRTIITTINKTLNLIISSMDSVFREVKKGGCSGLAETNTSIFLHKFWWSNIMFCNV